MPGKVNNGFNSMLNDIKNNLFHVFCVLTSFFPSLYKIPSFAIFVHSFKVHFINSYNNNQMFVGPLSIKMKYLSFSQNIENIELSLPVPFCLVH